MGDTRRTRMGALAALAATAVVLAGAAPASAQRLGGASVNADRFAFAQWIRELPDGGRVAAHAWGLDLAHTDTEGATPRQASILELREETCDVAAGQQVLRHFEVHNRLTVAFDPVLRSARLHGLVPLQATEYRSSPCGELRWEQRTEQRFTVTAQVDVTLDAAQDPQVTRTSGRSEYMGCDHRHGALSAFRPSTARMTVSTTGLLRSPATAGVLAGAPDVGHLLAVAGARAWVCPPAPRGLQKSSTASAASPASTGGRRTSARVRPAPPTSSAMRPTTSPARGRHGSSVPRLSPRVT
jgi:hypothetical protein